LRRRGEGRFNLPVTAPADIDGLSLEALKALVMQLLSKSADQDRLIAELREENARLKGLNGRPRIKPSGMENPSELKRPGERSNPRRRGKIAPRVAIEDRVIKAQVPPGSRFNLNPAVGFELRAGFAVRHNHCEQLRLAQGAAADRVDAL
jgi:hypothetical protein